MIKKLSDRIIKQIAAGEVIQKPYNTIKELIENSIDAKATDIQIFFKEYGMDSITIIDNGSGFTKKDLKIATQLHTTSKTNESDFMFGLDNFGFRGEALASIDVISDLTIESNGFKFEKGTLSSSILETGTRISVKNLFKNVPARLKFIKKPQIEFKFIKDLIKKFLIKHYDISWLINLNGRNLWKISKDSIENRIKLLFKEEPIQKLAANEHAKINAFILKNHVNISIIYVNNRAIKDRSIYKYISSLFKEYTFINENPGYILDINIDPLLVDYNTHPSKEEIKFINYSYIFTLLHSIFSMHQLSKHLIPIPTSTIFTSISPNDIPKTQTEIYSLSTYNIIKKDKESIIMENDTLENISLTFPTLFNELPNIQENIEITQNTETLTKEETPLQIPLFKLIGQLKNSYILFENKYGLGIFDQHAAHERKIYEELKNQLNQSSSQKLLSSIPLRLSTERKIFLRDNIEKMKSKGIFINKDHIVSLPILFKNIHDLIYLLENIRIHSDIETEIDRLLANIACKNALKANTPLSTHQMCTLLQSALTNPPICNHGRPVFKYFSDNEIKNFFKRT